MQPRMIACGEGCRRRAIPEPTHRCPPGEAGMRGGHLGARALERGSEGAELVHGAQRDGRDGLDPPLLVVDGVVHFRLCVPLNPAIELMQEIE